MALPEQAQPAGTFWALALDGSALPACVPRVEARFERVGPEEAPALTQAMGKRSLVPVQRRFAAGKHCYVARVAGEVATYGWVTFDEETIGELRLRLRLGPGEAYIWDCATLPAYRGQRLYPALLSHIASELRAAGLHLAWIGANTENVASQKGFVLAGFQPVLDFFLASATEGQSQLQARHDAPETLVQAARRAVVQQVS
jgi:ribosomal protein S18 acetylase RimI-like enzyme